MEVENTLAKRIDTAGSNAAYDNNCKRLLANKQILARILKTCVAEFRDCSIKDIEEKYIEGTPQISEVAVHQDESGEFIQGVNTEDASMMEGTVTHDICFWAISPRDGKMIRLLINVESQNDYYPGYPIVKRGIYYCSRMISRQYGTEFTDSHYEKIKKVYSIWVCTNPPKYRRNTITAYSMNEQNIVGNVADQREDYDLLTVLTVCLGGSADKNYEGLLKMLDVLLSRQIDSEKKKKILQSEFDISMTKNMESEAMEMCNLSQGIVDETAIEHIMNLMDSLDLSEEESMNALKIPKERQKVYHIEIQEKRQLQGQT